ncbi:MAG: hypothetical protein HKO94_07755 [Flavobacteriaceae bacterium]|nr:hypothetical protein [Flavobacteriaceae bacterium]
MFNIHMLPASFGDSLLIEYGEKDRRKYILIDGGPYYQFDEIIETLREVVPDMKEIELLVITHVDIDHIDGIIRLLNHDPALFKIKNVWFNNYEDLSFEEPADLLGGIQGEYLNVLVDKKDLNKNEKPITIHRDPEKIKIDDDFSIRIINPTQKALKKLLKKWDKHMLDKDLKHDEKKIWERLNEDFRYEPLPADVLGEEKDVKSLSEIKSKEDKSEANRSSIALLITYKKKTCLMAADATSEDLKANLEHLDLLNSWGQLNVDAWKLSHHGSKKSNQAYLTKMIQAKKILISTDGKKYDHPDKETIARLIMNQESNLDIFFNYTSTFNKIWKKQRLPSGIKCTFHFPEEEGYKKVALIPDSS